MTLPSKPTGLLEALLAVQAEAPTLPKDKTATVPTKNGHYQYRYTDLATVVEKVGPLLNKHGLVWSSFPAHHEGTPVLRYRLAHAESRESVEGEMLLLLGGKTDSSGRPLPPDPQGQGSALTYARRYSLCAVLNLVADDDDDGNAAAQGRQGERAPARGNGKPAEGDSVPPEPLLTPAQLKRWLDRLAKSGIPPQRVDIIYAAAGVSDREKVTVSQAKRLDAELKAEIKRRDEKADEARQAAREAMQG